MKILQETRFQNQAKAAPEAAFLFACFLFILILYLWLTVQWCCSH